MLKRILDLSHLYVALLTLLILWLCSVVVMNFSFFNPIERALHNFAFSDVYYQVMQETDSIPESNIITIVDLTTMYDRGRIAQTIHDINACHPSVLGIDIMFEGLRGDPGGSDQLVEAITETKNPIIAFKLKDANTQTGEFLTSRHSFFAPLDGLQEGYTNVQHINLGGTIRNMSIWHLLANDTVYSLSYHLACKYSPDVANGTFPKRQFIDYTPTKFAVVPYDSIIQYKSLIENRIVLLGAINDDADMHYSPFGRTAGTIIQAYAIQTLLEHHHTKEVPFFWTLLISFVVIILVDILQGEISHHVLHARSRFIRFFFQTGLIKNLINLIIISILVWINFLLFTKIQLYFNPNIMLMGIALLVESRLFYMSGIAAYADYRANLSSSPKPLNK